jgi:hypothetical protein
MRAQLGLASHFANRVEPVMGWRRQDLGNSCSLRHETALAHTMSIVGEPSLNHQEDYGKVAP